MKRKMKPVMAWVLISESGRVAAEFFNSRQDARASRHYKKRIGVLAEYRIARIRIIEVKP